MTKHLLSVLAFIVVSFAVQGLNHFVINKAYYDKIEFARAEPVIALGFLTMIIQGLLLTFAMTKITSTGSHNNRWTLYIIVFWSVSCGLYCLS